MVLSMCHRCRLRAKVEIENAGKEFCCWQRFGGELSNKASSVNEPEAASVGWGKSVDYAGEAAAQGDNLGWKWFKDPRMNCLGFRGIFPSDTIGKTSGPKSLFNHAEIRLYDSLYTLHLGFHF